MSSASLQPGLVHGLYPERSAAMNGALEMAARRLRTTLAQRLGARQGDLRRFAHSVGERESVLRQLGAGPLRAMVLELRERLAHDGLSPELCARAFAVVRLMSERELGMRHYDVQLMSGRIILDGMLAEMETGEGKTLTAALPASTAALAGVPVHVITANDYLAARDAETMAPLYTALGLSVGVVTEGLDANAREAAYAADVTYCTGKQVTFDYLKDRLARAGVQHDTALRMRRLQGNASQAPRLLMRGLCFAIVDEADSVLVDEARTPLILSRCGTSKSNRAFYEQALGFARALTPEQDFVVGRHDGSITISERGRVRLNQLCESAGGLWAGERRRESLVHSALVGEHVYQRDRHYLVNDGKVQIIDETTGRLMPDRSWQRGLHQIIEVKEGCELSGERETLTRTTYQLFFRRYLRLGGMSGTLREVAGELAAVYDLQTRTVPRNRPCRRTAHPARIHARLDGKWDAIVDTVRRRSAAGQPVLVGTRSVADSEHLSERLARAGVVHQVLNARQDAEEAAIVAGAGEAGAVTVATNMAGRGTDIKLCAAAVEAGGLHVIIAERNVAGRVDRQLIGRSARQNDPGSHETCVSLEDDIMTRHAPRLLRALVLGLSRLTGAVPQGLGRYLADSAQRHREREDARGRKSLLKLEEHLADLVAFSGRPD